MKINDFANKSKKIKEDGVIVPGVNTTVDVKPGQTEKEAAKFGNGKIASLMPKKGKDNTIHTLYNMGLTEGDMEADKKNPHAQPYLNTPEWKMLHDIDDKIIGAYVKHKSITRAVGRGLKKGYDKLSRLGSKNTSTSFDDGHATTTTTYNEADGDDKEDLKGFDAKTQYALKALQAKYPHADNLMSAMMAQTEDTLSVQKDYDKKSQMQDEKHNNRFQELEQKMYNIIKKNNLTENRK